MILSNYFIIKRNCILVKLNMTPFAGVVSVQDPEYLKIILNNFDALNKGYMYTFLDWDRSLLSIEVDQWRPLRKHFNKGFTIPTLKTFVDIFDKNSKIVVEKIDKHVHKGDFCLKNYLILAAVDNVCGKTRGNFFKCRNLSYKTGKFLFHRNFYWGVF